METETNADLSFMTALDELYGLGFDHYREYEARIDRVTKDDIKRLARQYLDIKKASIVLSRSKMNGEEKR
jgi:zinc protease